jgi:phosphoserine phosphatase
MIPAAFFDMDRTLLRCNTGTLYIRWLRKHREISLPRMLQALAWMAQYKLSVLDMEAVTARVIAEMAGQSEAEMYEKCRAFFEAWVRS